MALVAAMIPADQRFGYPYTDTGKNIMFV